MPANQIVVGYFYESVGVVLDTECYNEASKTYQKYCRLSENGIGRVGGEPVTWMRSGTVYVEFSGERGSPWFEGLGFDYTDT